MPVESTMYACSPDDLEDDDWRKNAQPRFKEEAFKKVTACSAVPCVPMACQ